MESFLHNIQEFLSEHAVKFLLSLLFSGVVLFVGFRLVRLCVRVFDRSKLANKMDPTAHSFIRSLLTIGLELLLLITIAGIVGIPTASIIAVLGSAGVAIGLAMQGSLSNFAGGVMILLFKPFVQGDFIQVADNEAGRVTNISIFYTTMITVDNRSVVIPNGSVSNAPIINFSSQPVRRLDLTFGAAYAADSERVRAIILSVAAARERISKEPAPEVVIKELGESAVRYELHAWCASSDYLSEKYAVTEQVKRRFDAEGVAIPFPQMDVHVV